MTVQKPECVKRTNERTSDADKNNSPTPALRAGRGTINAKIKRVFLNEWKNKWFWVYSMMWIDPYNHGLILVIHSSTDSWNSSLNEHKIIIDIAINDTSSKKFFINQTGWFKWSPLFHAIWFVKPFSKEIHHYVKMINLDKLTPSFQSFYYICLPHKGPSQPI